MQYKLTKKVAVWEYHEGVFEASNWAEAQRMVEAGEVSTEVVESHVVEERDETVTVVPLPRPTSLEA